MDVQHLIPFVEAFDRADDNAVGVAATDTWLGDDVSHLAEPFVEKFIGQGKDDWSVPRSQKQWVLATQANCGQAPEW
jgi:hypothetical protein